MQSDGAIPWRRNCECGTCGFRGYTSFERRAGFSTREGIAAWIAGACRRWPCAVMRGFEIGGVVHVEAETPIWAKCFGLGDTSLELAPSSGHLCVFSGVATFWNELACLPVRAPTADSCPAWILRASLCRLHVDRRRYIPTGRPRGCRHCRKCCFGTRVGRSEQTQTRGQDLDTSLILGATGSSRYLLAFELDRIIRGLCSRNLFTLTC